MKAIYILLLTAVAHGVAYSQTEKAIYRDRSFIDSVLKQHNSYRLELNLPALEWSSSLASDALAWGQKLLKGDRGQHDPQVRAMNEGENLWWGTADAFSYAQMVDGWGSEKKDFVYGTFPDCKTRRSAVVGHYTQMIWKNTRSVGCALVGIVTFGSMAGSMLPFLLRALRFDPAAASAPFVATLVDVTGLVIYFSIARATILDRIDVALGVCAG